MLIFGLFGCASYDVSFENSSDIGIYDTGLDEEPSIAAEDGNFEELTYHWQPVIDLKIDSDGNVIFEGSKAEIWFFENGALACVEEVTNLALVQVEAPIEQAQSWWQMSFSRSTVSSGEAAGAEGASGCMDLEIQSFAIGVGAVHSETLASWGGINWQGLEPLGISQVEHSSYISFDELAEIWVYGIAVADDGWMYLRPSYRFPL